MDELIEALALVRPYMSDYGVKYPTGCEHDVMFLNVDTNDIPLAVLSRLEELSFSHSDEYDSLVSYKFGSC